MAERDEKKIDRWHPYVGSVNGVRVVTPKDVDEKIDERLTTHKFRILESLLQILESVEIAMVSEDIGKARKELRKQEAELHHQLVDGLSELSSRLTNLEKKGESWEKRIEGWQKQAKLVEQSKDTLEELNLLRDHKLRDFISRLGDKGGESDE